MATAHRESLGTKIMTLEVQKESRKIAENVYKISLLENKNTNLVHDAIDRASVLYDKVNKNCHLATSSNWPCQWVVDGTCQKNCGNITIMKKVD